MTHGTRSGRPGVGAFAKVVFGWGFAALWALVGLATARGAADAAAVTNAVKGPKIECAEANHDFGVLTNEELVVYAYTIRNAGTQALLIERVQTSCGCTTTALKERTIAPGKEVQLETRLSMQGRAGGKQHKTITVYSNDPKKPQLALSLSGEIKRDVELQPDRIFFRQISGEPLAPQTSMVLSTTGKPFHLTSVETNEANFCRVTWRAVEEGRRYEIKLEPHEEAITGKTLSGNVVIHTDQPKFAAVRLSVIAYVQQEVTISPNVLFISPAQNEPETRKRQLLIHSHANKPIEVVRVEKPEGTEAATNKLGDRDWRIDVTLPEAVGELNEKQFKVHVKKWDATEMCLEATIRMASGSSPSATPVNPKK